MEVQQNSHRFYVAEVSGKQLLKNAFVSRRNEDATEGFQRELNVARAKEIAHYLDYEQRSIPTNIIVSAQAEARMRFGDGFLSWENIPRAFLVLDGQHRLYAMNFSNRDFHFGLSAYLGLKATDEVALFIDINTKQRGVPSALLLDIKQLAGTETDAEEQLRELFDFVAGDFDSPLRGLMSPAKAQKGMVSRTTFNNALRKVVQDGHLEQVGDSENKGKLIVNYLRAMDMVLGLAASHRHKLTNATTLAAFFELFGDVLVSTLSRAGKLRAEDIFDTVRPWAGVEFDKHVGSNNATKAKLIAELRSTLRVLPVVTAEMLA